MRREGKLVLAAVAALLALCQRGVAENSYGLGALVSSELAEPMARMCREIGVTVHRSNIQPGFVRGKDGSYDFTRVDARYEAFARQGVRWLPELKFPMPKPGKRPQLPWPIHADENLPLWEDFVRRTAEHMRGRITDWEIWNEQNISSFWRNPNPADYLKLLRRTADILREVDPKNRVVLGGLAGVPLAYIEELYRLGGKDAFDVMNVHLYAEHKPANIPERFFDEQLDALKDLMARYGDAGKPIWVTETGWPTHVDDEIGEHKSNDRWSEGVLRKLLETALPGRAGLRVLCVADEADSRRIDPGTVRFVASAMPKDAVVTGCRQEEVPQLLDAGKADVFVWCIGNAFYDVDVPALERFVAGGGVVLASGIAPLMERYVRDARGAVRLERVDRNGGALLERFRVRADLFARSGIDKAKLAAPAGIRIQERFVTDALLGSGDRMEEVAAAVAPDGRRFPLAAVYRSAGKKGAFAVSTVNRRFWRSCTEERQAVRLARNLGLLTGAGVSRIVCFQFWAKEADARNVQDHFGIVHSDLKPKPAYATYGHFIRMRPEGSVNAPGEWRSKDRCDYTPNWVRPDGKRAGMLWTIGRPYEKEVPFDAPVTFTDVYGRSLEFPRTGRGYRIRLTDSPVYWASRR